MRTDKIRENKMILDAMSELDENYLLRLIQLKVNLNEFFSVIKSDMDYDLSSKRLVSNAVKMYIERESIELGTSGVFSF